MESPVRSTKTAENTVVATFSEINMDEFIALVEANPDIHYRFNAAGDIIQMSPTFIHADVQGAIVTHFNNWLWQGALPGYRRARSQPTISATGVASQTWPSTSQRGKVIPQEAPLVAVEVRSDSNTWPELRGEGRALPGTGDTDGVAGRQRRAAGRNSTRG